MNAPNENKTYYVIGSLRDREVEEVISAPDEQTARIGMRQTHPGVEIGEVHLLTDD